jgi:hypothetical protein
VKLIPIYVRLHNFYDELVNEDIRTFDISSGYDVVILGDVLEHITRDEAVVFIEKLKKHSKCIYLTIPISYCPQGAAQGNPFEAHKYHWSDKEIRGLGFKLLNVSVNEIGLVAVGCYSWPEGRL